MSDEGWGVKVGVKVVRGGGGGGRGEGGRIYSYNYFPSVQGYPQTDMNDVKDPTLCTHHALLWSCVVVIFSKMANDYTFMLYRMFNTKSGALDFWMDVCQLCV